MSNQKRRLASPDSDPYSSSPPSVEGTSVWSGKKGRVPRQTPRGKDLEMQMEEQQIKMKELESQMEEMKKLRKGVKELKRKNKEQENEIKELRNREEEREKEMKKLKKWVKEIRNKPDSNCLSSGNPSSPRTVQEGNTKRLKLHIEMKVPKRAYTGGKLAGDPGNSIPIKLIDVENGLTITSGTESSVTVHVVALKGNFNKEEHDYWSAAYFNSFIVEGRQQKGQPLVGTLKVTLKEGVGFINNLKFMDNSSWSEEKKFRIGVHVDSGYKGTRILEAFTEPIIVLEQRGAGNKKHDTPESSDEVWRLEGIGKGGPFHNRLKGAGIYNVEEFLQTFNRDSEKLKSILGRTMTDPKWFPLINHAQKCPPNEKWLVYYSSDGSNNAALFDNFARSTGFICNGVPRLIHSLSDREKEAADCLVELAYRNWKEVTKYEGIIPRREAVAVPLGIDDMILISPSTAQNHPTQTSLQGRSSIPDETTNSSVAAKEATVSQQPFQGETSMDALPAVFTSPQGSHGIFDGLSLDEFLIDWTHLEKP